MLHGFPSALGGTPWSCTSCPPPTSISSSPLQPIHLRFSCSLWPRPRTLPLSHFRSHPCISPTQSCLQPPGLEQHQVRPRTVLVTFASLCSPRAPLRATAWVSKSTPPHPTTQLVSPKVCICQSFSYVFSSLLSLPSITMSFPCALSLLDPVYR